VPSQPRIHAYASVGRTGLGNMLFPWARAEVFSRQFNAVLLAPQWFQPLRVGPWLRGERDKRYYLGQFTHAGYLTGPARLARLWLSPRVEESAAGNSPRLGSLVVFRGMGQGFDGLHDHREFLWRRLMELARSDIRDKVGRLTGGAIGVHIRRGDFRVAPGERFARTGDYEVSLTWYANAIGEARRRLGADVPVRIFSDAPPAELADFRRLPNVEIMPAAPALQDLLMLSRSALIVGTAKSTFSLWAAFFSRAPTLWPPSANFQRYGLGNGQQIVWSPT